MLVHQFFAKYANTPLGDRLKPINVIKYGVGTNLSSIYQRMHELEDIMRPMRIEQEELIKKAEDFWFYSHE